MPLSWPHGATRPGWRSHVSRETLSVARPVFRVPRGSGRGRGWSGHWCWSRGYDWVSAWGVARGGGKGGTSAKIGTYTVDGVKVEQGSAAYVGDRLATDVDFHQKMRENPALWEAIKDGRVTVHSDIAIARSGNAGKIDFKTVPIELDPAHITRVGRAIKGH